MMGSTRRVQYKLVSSRYWEGVPGSLGKGVNSHSSGVRGPGVGGPGEGHAAGSDQ